MSHIYNIHDIESAAGQTIANMAVEQSAESREIAYIDVDSRSAAESLIPLISDDCIDCDSMIVDETLQVWGECNAGDFRVHIRIANA